MHILQPHAIEVLGHKELVKCALGSGLKKYVTFYNTAVLHKSKTITGQKMLEPWLEELQKHNSEPSRRGNKYFHSLRTLVVHS